MAPRTLRHNANVIKDPDIRFTVLSSLDKRFDRHLSQAENVRSLFVAMNDEVLVNRDLAVLMIGRLANYNPACVMPSMRKALIQLLTELEYSTVVCVRSISARISTHFPIQAGQRRERQTT